MPDRYTLDDVLDIVPDVAPTIDDILEIVPDSSADALPLSSAPVSPYANLAPRPAEASIRDRADDIAISALRGILGVPQFLVGLADIPTGGRAGKLLKDTTGIDFERGRQILAQGYSPEQQQESEAVRAPETLMGTAAAALKNPSTIVQSIVESVPSMIGGGLIGRGVRTVLPKIVPGLAGAIGEGAVTAGSAAEQARSESPDGLLTPGQSLGATATGVGTAIIGRYAGKLAEKLGIADVDTMLAGAAKDQGARQALVKQIVLGAVQEGGLEELPQSVQEQIAQNLMGGRQLWEGVDEAAVMGLLTGGVMGAGVQVVDAVGRPAQPAPPVGRQPSAQAPTTPAAAEVVTPPVEPTPGVTPIPVPPTVADIVEVIDEPAPGVNERGVPIEPMPTDPAVLPADAPPVPSIPMLSPEEQAYERIRNYQGPDRRVGSQAARDAFDERQRVEAARKLAAAERGEVDTRAAAAEAFEPPSEPITTPQAEIPTPTEQVPEVPTEVPEVPVDIPTVEDVVEVVDEPSTQVEKPEVEPFRVKRIASLKGEDAKVQERAAAAVEANPDRMVAKYLKRFKEVLNADNASELFEDYARSSDTRSRFVRAVRPAAAAVVERAYKHLLARPVAKGKSRVVVFTGGGNGSGKSSTLSLLDKAAVVVDSTLSDYEASRQNIQKALDAGFDVRIAFVHRDPVESLVGGTLPRAMKEGAGRTVPLSVHARTHIEAPKVLRRLADTFKDEPRVTVEVFENQAGDPTTLTLSELKEGAYADRDVLLNDLVAAADAEYAKGHISEAVYRGTVGRAPQRDAGGARRDQPADARQPSSDRRQAPSGAVGDGPRNDPNGGDRAAPPQPDEPRRPAVESREDRTRRRRRDAGRRARERKATERQDRLDTIDRLIERAVADGFSGDPAVLRAELNNRLEALREMDAALDESGGNPQHLISEIRRLGGISIERETAYKGELKWLKEHFGGQGTQSMSGVVRSGKGDGLSLDDMFTHLKQDPAFAHIRTMDQLLVELRRIATTEKDTTLLHERLAKRLGEQWWANIQPTPDAIETLDQLQSDSQDTDDGDISFDPNELDAPPVGYTPTIVGRTFKWRSKTGTDLLIAVEQSDLEGVYDVIARDGDEQVGWLSIGPNRFDESRWSAISVNVNPENRRQGIASALYDTAYAAGIKPIVPDVKQSTEAQKMWRGRREWIPVKPPIEVTAQATDDVLDTGEVQPRLPGAEDARKTGKADTSFRAPVQASGDDFRLGDPEPEAPAGPGLFDEPQEATVDTVPERPGDARRNRRAKGYVEFSPAIKGPTGVTLTGYQWHYDIVSLGVDDRGEEIIRKVSDWENAVPNEETGREVVHEFHIKTADGTYQTVSLETALEKLGYLAHSPQAADGAKAVRSIASTVKARARAQMELDQLRAQEETIQERTKAIAAEVDALPRPEITRRLNDTGTAQIFEMGDAKVWQQGNVNTPMTQERRDELNDHWRTLQMTSRRVPLSHWQTIKELEQRIAKADKKIAAFGKVQAQAPSSGGGSEAMAGLFTTTLTPMPATITAVKPIEFPELVDLAREILKVPQVVKRFRSPGVLGMFQSQTGNRKAGNIRLHANLFLRTADLSTDTPLGATVTDSLTKEKAIVVEQTEQGPVLRPEAGGATFRPVPPLKRYRVDISATQLQQLAATLAHEVGHLIDWLPDYTLKRGNILGRLFTLRAFLKSTFVASDGQTIDAKDVRQELLDLSEKWRPWDAATSSASFNRYRKSSKELYADAISALLNNPGLVQQDAPIFFEQFFNELDKKPDVKQAYFGLQEVLAGTPEEVIRRRRAGVRGMFSEGDMKAMDLERLRQAERQESRKQWWQRFRIQHVDKNAAVRDRVDAIKKQGVTVNPDDDPRFMLEERNYLGGKLKAFAERHIEPLYRNITEGGIGWTTFGEALFYERVIAGDRSELANPRGITPDVAKGLYEDLKEGLDPEQQRELGEAVEQFREMVKGVAEQAYEAGLYTDELYQQMKANPAYAAYRVIDYIENDVTSAVYKQIGTLKDITNPADATILKALVTLRAIEHQRVKTSVFDFLHRHYPGDIAQAEERWNGRGRMPIESKDKKQILVTYKEKGKLRGKYVPEMIATSLNNESIGSNWTVVSALRWVNGNVFRPLFTTMNAGFQTFNAARDFLRFWKNQPTMTVARAIRLYAKAVPVARVRAFGMPEQSSVKYDAAKADLMAAEEARILGVTYNDMVQGREVEDTQIEDILAKLEIGEFGRPMPSKPGIRQAKAVLDFIAQVGDFFETLPKAAGIYEYTGEGSIADMPADKRSLIRRRIGSPDFLAGGTFKPITNELLLFSNAITQAIRTDIEVATDPETRAAFWWKTAKLNIAPKLAIFAAIYLAGAGDDEDDSAINDIRRALRGVTEYDLTNYLALPLGRDAVGNAVYVRVPQDDAGRLVGGLTWKALRFAAGDKDTIESAMQVFDYMTGQAPTVTPILEAAGDVATFAAGNNVYDSFRARMLFTDDELKARDWRTVKKFVGYEFQQLGGSAIWKFVPGEQRPRTLTTGQQILELPIVSNIAGRWIRITNYGEVERLRQAALQTGQVEASRRLDVREQANEAITALQALPAAERTPAKVKATAEAIAEKNGVESPAVLRRIRMGLARQDADPLTDVVLSAGSNAQKVSAITRAAAGMPRAEVNKWLADAKRERIISSEVDKAVRDALAPVP